MVKLTEEQLSRFARYLAAQERSIATIRKYLHDVRALREYAGELLTEKERLIDFKQNLIASGYAVSSINSMLAAVNRYLVFQGKTEWRLKSLKLQRTTFVSRERVLNKAEYLKMIDCALKCKNERLALLLQTICSTGIRVSELASITVEALKKGQTQIRLKGKLRQILLPKELCTKLQEYCAKRQISRGAVFVTRSGKPLDRSNIWKMMKRLARQTKVKAQKVFPHNLRHLFAVTYYKKYKDVVRLADILGHSSVNTTRIYTMKDGSEQRREMGSLCLLV